MKDNTEERELAWIGDAVLSLFSRSRILAEGRGMDPEKLQAMTCNQFLTCIGNPTRVEAEIGKVYKESGLQAAFQHIETVIIPVFTQQWTKKTRRRH